MERPGIRDSEAAKELYPAGNPVSMLVNQLARQGCPVRETALADRRADLVGQQVSRLDEADCQTLLAAVPALRRPADTLREEAERP